MTHSFESIIAMLEDESQLIDWDSQSDRIKRVGSRAIAESSISQTQSTLKAELNVVDGFCELPIDCMRFLVAEDLSGNEIDVIKEGDFIKPKRMANGKIIIKYKALPCGDDGYPIIHSVQLNYVFWTVFQSFMRDFRIEGKLDETMWREIKDNRSAALRDAKRPRLTTQDWDKGLWILRNGRYFMINPKRH